MNVAKRLCFIFLALASIIVMGQSNPSKHNSVYLELAGSGGLGSINYENQFYTKITYSLLWRAGFSIAPIDRNNGLGLVFPIMLNSLIGKHNHKLELGLGQGVTITTKGRFFALTTAAIGYRYQAATSRFFYRITYTPLISYLVDFQIQQWGGISLGYTFKSK